MSWSQGNRLWTVPFVSLNGTNCRVDIYKRGYAQSTVLTLKGAPDPVTFAEDDSDDLLNDVLRYQTGYIRIVEDYPNFCADIYPTGTFDRYVEVYYGETLMFNGYIQVQSFSDELIPTPRTLEFPIISPLGLIGERRFSNVSYLPPTTVRLDTLLDMVASNAGYQYIYVPEDYGYPNSVGLGMKISTLVISPWNENFHTSMSSGAMYKVMRGQTHDYLVEAICKAFGWICHDTPQALVFSAFDYQGDYYRYTVGHIGESAYTTVVSLSSTPLPLSDYCSLADDGASENVILPETGIEISYDGGDGSVREFEFKHFWVPSNDPIAIYPDFDPDEYPNQAEIFCICRLHPVPRAGETDVNSSVNFDQNGKIVIGNYAVAWDGREGFLLSMGSYNDEKTLFYVRFYLNKRANQSYGVNYDILLRQDGSIGGLHSGPDTDPNHKEYIKTFIDASNPDYVQVNFIYNWGGTTLPQLQSQALILIYNIKLSVVENNVPYERYRYLPSDDKDYLPDTDNPPVVSSSLSMPISLYRLNDNLIGNTVRSTKLTEYDYLFEPRRQLVSTFRIISMMSIPYIQLYSYLSKKWRIIALSYNIWNDEVTITAQHSSTL